MAEEEDLDPEILADTLEGMDGELEEKAESYAIVINSLGAESDMLKNEVERLSKRKRTVDNNIKRMKETLENAMLLAKKRKFKTAHYTFNIQKNSPALVIDDENKIPKQFYKIEESLDKIKLKDFVRETEKNGTQLSYAHLEQKEGLRIK